MGEIHHIPVTDMDRPEAPPPPPKKFESVEDVQKLLVYLQTELDTMRTMHKDNMKGLSEYFLFMARAIDNALLSGDVVKMRVVMQTTRDNLISTATDVTQ